MDEQPDGQKARGKIVQHTEDHESSLEANLTRIQFRVSVNSNKAKEIITYNKMLEYTPEMKNQKSCGNTKELSPMKYKGLRLLSWSNGRLGRSPKKTLSIMAVDDQVTCIIYATENGLLDQPGWKRFKHIAKNEKKFTRMVNQAKFKSFHTTPKYRYGYGIPKTYEQAKNIDEKNGNTLWGDATILELNQINEYVTFIDKGHHSKVTPPTGFKRIRVTIVYDIKHDGRLKARLVADGYLTDINLDFAYSGIVSLQGFWLVSFLAKLKELQLWATDIGNAYLEAYTSEKVYIIAGPKFGDREGHILVISKALYGLRSSGAIWHDRFADCIRELGLFLPCKAEPDIWMMKKNNPYKYITVYVDDLTIAMKNPKNLRMSWKINISSNSMVPYQ
jgi:Reverse transcriptase (RNA-dependent DNA polymerase)